MVALGEVLRLLAALLIIGAGILALVYVLGRSEALKSQEEARERKKGQ